MDEENKNTENEGAEESAPAEESKTEEAPAEETKTEEAPAAETKTEEAPAETATAEAPAEQESPKEDSGDGDGKRPTFLTVLCILTFIGSGLTTLVFLLGTMFIGAVAGILSSIGMAELVTGGAALFAVLTVLSAASLFGALQMWKLKKMGFYLYTGANIIGVFVPMMMVSAISFSAMDLLFPVVFIVLYGLNLKHMS